jgi:hypothetical protein
LPYRNGCFFSLRRCNHLSTRSESSSVWNRNFRSCVCRAITSPFGLAVVNTSTLTYVTSIAVGNEIPADDSPNQRQCPVADGCVHYRQKHID